MSRARWVRIAPDSGIVSPESRVWNSRTHIHNGLGYLAGALIHAGYHNVDIYDGAVEGESLDARLSREPVDVVGISSPTPLIYEAWRAAQTAKAHGAITILGGPHLTLMPDESLGHPAVDFVARGESERYNRTCTPSPGVSRQSGSLRDLPMTVEQGDDIASKRRCDSRRPRPLAGR